MDYFKTLIAKLILYKYFLFNVVGQGLKTL